MYPHVIRLRGPWGYELLTELATAEQGRIRLPRQANAGRAFGSSGRVRLRRVFHWPTELGPHEHVWLLCDHLPGATQIACNGRPVELPASDASLRAIEITAQLVSHNEVVIESTAAEIERWPGEVWLEVRERQYIQRCELRIEPVDCQWRLQLTGCVAGEPAEFPLELVIRHEAAELLYAEVSVETPFVLSSPLFQPPANRHAFEVELRLIRGGARVWEERRAISQP